MNTSKTTNLRQDWHVASLPISMPAMILLCVYLAGNSLTYIKELPGSLVTFALYGFLATAALSVFINGKLKIYSHTIWSVAFIILCCVSCIYSADAGRSLGAVISLIKVLMFTVMLCNIVTTEQRMKMAMSVCSLATIVLFAYLAANNMLDMEEGERLGNELTGNANILASLFMIGAMCSVYVLFFSKTKLASLLFFVVFIVQLAALAMSGGRKYFLVPVLLLAGMQIMRTDKKGRKNLLINVILVFAVLSALWWALFNVEFLYETIGYRMEGLIAGFTGEGEADASTRERQAMIKKALELWGESPIWGHGIDAFGALTHWGVYAHNNYVELLCDVGIIGTVVYYAYYIYMIVKLFKAPMPQLKKSFWILLLFGLLFFDFGAVNYNSFLLNMLLVFAMQAAKTKEISQSIDNEVSNRKADAL